MIFAQETAAAALDEALPLMRAHWDEVAYDDRPFDPYLAGYLAIESAGGLRVFTAREGGRLMGYIAFAVAPCMNHQTEIHANEAGTYLAPEARRGSTARLFLDYADAKLVAEGVKEIHYRVPTKHPTLGKILMRRGFTHDDSEFVRRF